MNILNILSLIVEISVMVMGLVITFSKKKVYGLGIAFTFGIYIFYDFARFISWNIRPTISESLFLVASLSIFWAVWRISKENSLS